MEKRSSDIHIEPREFDFRIRFRVDGVLHDQLSLPRERFAAVVSRIKLISAIDIAERRLPQDGRMSIRVSGTELDVRVSTLPGVHGESVVMRLLPKEREGLRLDRLGMLPDHLRRMRAWVAEPHGIILVTGPTGSGKSTTLYGALEEINDGVRKLISVEDPVEYQVPNITQVQVHADIGLTFAAALRSILRQDPDVIMIGEIRDLETAEIAVQSSLTGHLKAFDPAYQRCGECLHALDRHGRGTLPGGFAGARCPGPATGAQVVRPLRGTLRANPCCGRSGSDRGGHRAAVPGAGSAMARGARLRPLRRYRLQRPCGHLRTRRSVFRDARPDRAESFPRTDASACRQPGTAQSA